MAFHSSTGSLFPGVPFSPQVPRIDPDKGTVVSTTKEEAADTTRYVVVYGIAKYDDIFGVHHYTKFCEPIVLQGPYNGGECHAYNNVDNN